MSDFPDNLPTQMSTPETLDVSEQSGASFRSILNVFNPASLSPEERGAFFAAVGERQAELDDIIEFAGSPEQASRELNHRFNTDWDDEQGLAFLHIIGVELPGLEIHGRAEGLVISASKLDGANFEGADLEASVFAMSVLRGLRARGANLNMALLPFSEISGDFTDAQAVDANFNLARLRINAHRANFANAFMIGTTGLTTQNLEEARFNHAVLLGHQQPGTRALTPAQTLSRALAGGFSVAKGEETPSYRTAVVHQGVDARYRLAAARNAEGQLWYGVDISDARLTEFNLVAGVLGDVSMARANANGMRAPGLITIDNSTMRGIKARQAWMPGSVHIGTDFTGADFTDIHMPGSVLVEPVLTGVIAENANIDGMAVVTTDPKHANELQEQTNTKMRVLEPSTLPSEVSKIVARTTRLSAKPTKALKK